MVGDDIEERCRQITVLLAYPKVGALSPAAVAANLGTTEYEIRTAVQALLRAGSIVQTSDGRLADPFAPSPRSTADSGSQGH